MYVLKNIFKRGYEEIRDRKLLKILKKDRTWLKYELHCNVKTPAPLFFKNNLTFVIQMLINEMSSRESFLFEHFFLHMSRESNNIYCFCLILFIRIINFINDDCKLNLYVSLIMTLICLDPCQWSLMSLITGNKVKKNTQAKVL